MIRFNKAPVTSMIKMGMGGIFFFSLSSSSLGSELTLSKSDASEGINILHQAIRQIIGSDHYPKIADDMAELIIAGCKDPIPLSQKLALEIVSRYPDGTIRVKYSQKGQHAVSHIKNVFFKAPYLNGFSNEMLSNDCGKERAAYWLHSGQGIMPTTLCVLNHVKINHKNQSWDYKQFTVQASLGISGEDFDDFLGNFSNDAQISSEIDAVSLSDWILLSFLTCPTDAKPDNFVVDKTTKPYKLISIDSDLIWFNPYEYIEKYDEERVLRLKLRNVLYFLPNIMNAHPPKEVFEKILNFIPNDFVLNWLNNLQKNNQEYTDLLEGGIISQETYDNEGFPISLPLTKIQEMVYCLKKLQFWMKRGLTHRDLLRNVHPLVFLCYNELQGFLKPGKAPWKALKFLYDDWDDVEFLLRDRKHILQKDGRSLKEIMLHKKGRAKTAGDENPIPVDEVLEYFLCSEKNSAGTLSSSISTFINAYGSEEVTPSHSVDTCNLPEINLTSEEGSALYSCLLKKPHQLKNLNLCGNYLDIKSLEWLLPMLETQNCLLNLNLCDNDLGIAGASMLPQCFPFLPNLTVLNLSGNWIQNDGLQNLSKSCANYLPHLTFLGLGENQLSEEANQWVTHFIEQHENLRYLDLRWNHLTNSTAEALLPVIMCHPALNVVYLDENPMESAFKHQVHISLIKAIVRHTISEENLLLREGLLKDVKQLSVKLPSDVTELLTGKNNTLSVRSSTSVPHETWVLEMTLYMETILNAPSLISIETWSEIRINNTHIETLSETLGTMKSLKKLHLHGILIDCIDHPRDEMIQQFIHCIGKCQNLTSLLINGNSEYKKTDFPFPNDDILEMILCKHLINLKKLEVLILPFNHIRDQGGMAIAKIIPDLFALRTVKLKNNKDIKEKGILALIQAQHDHKTLTKLSFDAFTLRTTNGVSAEIKKNDTPYYINSLLQNILEKFYDKSEINITYSSKYYHQSGDGASDSI